MKRTLASVALAATLVLIAGASSAFAGTYDYLLAPSSVCPNQENTSASVATQEMAMRCMHNYVRTKKKLPYLSTRDKLLSATNSKSIDIMRCGFSHTACGRDTFYWTKRTGYTSGGCYGLGENIAWGSGSYGSVRHIMRAWLHSDGHRHNILKSSFRDKGVGLVKGRFAGYSNAQVWTAQFGYRC